GVRTAQARRFRGDDPHHRHRTGRAGPSHAGGLSARPADRGAALGLPRVGIPPRGRGDRDRPRVGGAGAGPLEQDWHHLMPRNAATAAASRRPCARPACAEGRRQQGSSAFEPYAASDSSSANTPSAAPRNSPISTAGPAPKADGADSPAGTSTTAAPQSPATSRLIVLPMPPSM